MASAESTVPLPDVPQKTCLTCHQHFPATQEYFHKHNSKDGLHSYCRWCRNTHNRDRYHFRRGQQPPPKRVPLPPPPDSQKTCYKCRQTFPATTEHFHRDNSTKDGLHRRCKTCAHAYAMTHKEQGLAYARKQQRLYPERRRLAAKKWRDTHKDQYNAQAREYRTLYPDRVKASQQKYTRSHPDKMRVKNHRHRTRKLALPVTYTEAMWQTACAYFHHACAVCGREEGFFWTLAHDHWIPLSDPSCPGTVATNIVPLCHPREGMYESCNTTKQAQDPRVWLRAKLGPRQARAKLKEIEAFFVHMQTLS